MNKKGFLSMAVIIIFAIIAAFSYVYWNLSSQELYMIFREGDKIKATTLAESGVNYAKSMLNANFLKGQWPVISPSIKYPKIKKKFDNGYFEIKKISPLHRLKLKDSTIEKNYLHQIYRDAYGRKLGFYDIYEVIVLAKINNSGVSVTLKSYIKTIHLEDYWK